MESNELTVGISHDHTALRHRSILNGDGKCEVKILIIGCAEAFSFLELPRDDGGEVEPPHIATDEIEAAGMIVISPFANLSSPSLQWLAHQLASLEVKTAIKRGEFAGVLSRQRLRFCDKPAH
ncbi:MAG: hypothetical protein WB713_14980 [Methyloceanibacter sp.]